MLNKIIPKKERKKFGVEELGEARRTEIKAKEGFKWERIHLTTF